MTRQVRIQNMEGEATGLVIIVVSAGVAHTVEPGREVTLGMEGQIVVSDRMPDMAANESLSLNDLTLEPGQLDEILANQTSGTAAGAQTYAMTDSASPPPTTIDPPKLERLQIENDAAGKPQLVGDVWPKLTAISPAMIGRSDFISKLPTEKPHYEIILGEKRATYRVVEGGPSFEKLELVSSGDFYVNGGPLRDDQIDQGAETMTLRAGQSESNRVGPMIGEVAEPVGATNLAEAHATGGGVGGPNMTTATSDTEGAAPARNGADGGQPAAGGADGAPTRDSFNMAEQIAAPGGDRGEPQGDGENSQNVEEGEIEGTGDRAALDAAEREAEQINRNTAHAADLERAEEASHADADVDGPSLVEIMSDDGYVGENTDVDDQAVYPASDDHTDFEIDDNAEDAQLVHEIDLAGSGESTDEVGTVSADGNMRVPTEEEAASFTTKHRGRGSYSIMDASGEEVVQMLSKAEADAFKADTPAGRVEWLRTAKGVMNLEREEPTRSED